MNDEEVITTWIAEQLGARVVGIQRQPRWRAAWLVASADLDDLVPFLGYRLATWQEGDTALEQFVLADQGQHDEQLCHPFYRRQIRHKDTLGPPGSAMVAHHACQPFPQRVSEKS
ncbi:hypothetical protein BN979_03987 [Mycolicibacterium vulneris]|nr:hypothetical protein BST41_04120 [Mycolicibacterium porcinum]CDO31174.1 hypothetical protein BN979_03987 [Mycolicibacterium vulneris]